MNGSKKKDMDEQLLKLRNALLKDKKWPQKYMFKFIVPNQNEKIEEVKNLFNKTDKLSFKVSKDIRYVSITSQRWVSTPDEVIQLYQRASKIERLIAL